MESGERARLVEDLHRRLRAAGFLANGLGAVVVFVFLVFLYPTQEFSEPDGLGVLAANTGVGAAYLLGSLWAGNRWSIRIRAPVDAWLLADRPADDTERRRVLRLPLRLAGVAGSLWLLAALIFCGLNAFLYPEFLGEIATGLALGGISTTALGYLVAERILRPVFALALAGGVPERPALPGVRARLVMAWALAAGVPLLGVALVAVVGLVDDDADSNLVAGAVLFLSVIAIGVGVVVLMLTARSIADPLGAVRAAVRQVEEGDLDARVPVDDGSEVGLLQAGFNRMAEGLQERERLHDLFGRHVGREVASAALERGVRLGGEQREVAALFVDIVGSTALAARREPTEVVQLLNRFFEVVVEVVEGHGGWVNKFEGDAALAVFGAPMEREGFVGEALAAARELRGRLARAVPDLDFGIGVSAGMAVAGNVGSEQRYEYTVVGDPVNEAARLCELAKARPGRVLASASALDRAGEEASRWEEGEQVALRGRSEATRLAEPRQAPDYAPSTSRSRPVSTS
jgi:adenylate cyclase